MKPVDGGRGSARILPFPARKPVEAQPAPPVAPPPPAPPLPAMGKTWSPPAEKPAAGGLHQLALASFAGKTTDAGGDPAIDFSAHRPGMNNRALYGAIVADLEALFGVKLHYGYSARQNEADRDGFKIGEKDLDVFLEHAKTPAEKRAVASFVIAHEVAHVILKHPALILDRARVAGFQIKSYSGYRPILEMQADYLAAKYLVLRGLPLEPVQGLFQREGLFPAGDAYPPGKTRSDHLALAAEAGFRLDLFQNDLVDCLAFLDFLAGKPPAPP